MTYGIEHQWRPYPNMDFVAAFNHGVVPSARELVSYDQVVLRSIWLVRDWWQATGGGSFSFYNDDNSFVNAEVENLFLLSERLDIWGGMHSSITTTDEESDLYWSPFWEQRHYLILEIRRSFPDFTASFRGHLGFQKERARDEDIQEFLNLQAVAEEQVKKYSDDASFSRMRDGTNCWDFPPPWCADGKTALRSTERSWSMPPMNTLSIT